jgi:hypothetical protein
MPFCPKCGKQVSDQSKFCLSCGAQLDVNIISAPITKPTRLWYVIAFIFSIFGGIIGYFAVKDEDKNMANNLIITGFLSILFWFIFIFAFGILAILGI